MKTKPKPTKAMLEAKAFCERAKLLKAKIGELLPAEQGKRTDKLPTADVGSCAFNPSVIAAYRKIAANKGVVRNAT